MASTQPFYPLLPGSEVLTPAGRGTVLLASPPPSASTLDSDAVTVDLNGGSRQFPRHSVRPVTLHVDEANGVAYRIMTPETAAEASKVTALSFHRGEPLTKALGVTREGMQRFVDMYVPRMAREGYTVMAQDLQTGQVLGAFLNEDFCNADPPEAEAFVDKAEGDWVRAGSDAVWLCACGYWIAMKWWPSCMFFGRHRAALGRVVHAFCCCRCVCWMTSWQVASAGNYWRAGGGSYGKARHRSRYNREGSKVH